jgi:hypothetical protein
VLPLLLLLLILLQLPAALGVVVQLLQSHLVKV